MNKMILGIVLIAVGCGLAYFGYTESQTFRSQVTEVFSGSPSNKAMYFYIGAAISALAGVLAIVKK